MNLQEEILKKYSKAQCAKIVQWVGDSKQRFNELFYLFLNDEYRETPTAAGAVSYCVEAHPGFLKDNFGKLLKNLEKPLLLLGIPNIQNKYSLPGRGAFQE